MVEDVQMEGLIKEDAINTPTYKLIASEDLEKIAFY